MWLVYLSPRSTTRFKGSPTFDESTIAVRSSPLLIFLPAASLGCACVCVRA